MRIARLLLGGVLALAMSTAHAEPAAFDYRCGVEIVPGSTLPSDGWTTAVGGSLPPKAGNPCWLRIATEGRVPRALSFRGGAGDKAIALFDASGQAIAEAHDVGLRRGAIVSGGQGPGGRMLFPDIAADVVFARIEHAERRIQLEFVDLAQTVTEDQFQDLVQVGLAAMYLTLAILLVVIGMLERDPWQGLFALYFGITAAITLVSDEPAALALGPGFSFFWTDNLVDAAINCVWTVCLTILLRLNVLWPALNRILIGIAALFLTEPFFPSGVARSIDSALNLAVLTVMVPACWRAWRAGERLAPVIAVSNLGSALILGPYFVANLASYFVEVGWQSHNPGLVLGAINDLLFPAA